MLRGVVLLSTISCWPNLTRHEGKAGAQLQQERLDLAQQRRFEVFFGITVLQAEDIEKVGIAKYQVWRQPVLRPQCIEFPSDEPVGFLRQRRALKQHAANLFFQRPRVPAFDAAHLGVEIAFERVFDVDQAFEMRPGQLSPQRGDNLFIGKRLRKADHVAQRLLGKPAPEFPFQLPPRRGDYLFAVVRTLLLQDFLKYVASVVSHCSSAPYLCA
jgi:hypothetical protein